MKKFICVGEKYQAKDGTEKISYKRIGEIFTAKTGKEYAKLYFMPGSLLSIFEEENKQKPAAQDSDFDEFGADNKTPF